MINHMVNHFPDAPALDVLGDRTRRRLVTLLASGPRPASDLAETLHISRPAVSRHLRLLRSRGLIEEEPVSVDRRVRLCRLRIEPLAEVEQWSERVQNFWTTRLAAFAQYVSTQETPPGRGRRRPRSARRRGA